MSSGALSGVGPGGTTEACELSGTEMVQVWSILVCFVPVSWWCPGGEIAGAVVSTVQGSPLLCLTRAPMVKWLELVYR